jgi:hypothetical protein
VLAASAHAARPARAGLGGAIVFALVTTVMTTPLLTWFDARQRRLIPAEAPPAAELVRP